MASHRRRTVLLIVVAAALLAAGIPLLFSRPAPFPESGELAFRAPLLRVPSAGCYEDERYRVLLVVGDEDSVEARFNWDPEDGRGRVRRFAGVPTALTRPAPSVVEKLWNAVRRQYPSRVQSPAIVIVKDPEAPFPVLPARNLIGSARVYLGGLDGDGKIGAVPFQVHAGACSALTGLGVNVVPNDLCNGAGLVVELRITREDDRVVYRWGPNPYYRGNDPSPRLSWGEARCDPEDVTDAGEGPLLPELSDLIQHKAPPGSPRVIFLSAGTGVRTVDYLRAVECGGGDPMVLFVPYPISPSRQGGGRLVAAPAGVASVLREEPDIRRVGRRLAWIQLDEGGEIRCRGRLHDPDTLRQYLVKLSPAAAEIRADGAVKWSDCRPALDVVLAVGCDLYFEMAPLDPVLDIPVVLQVPRPPPGATLVELHLAHVDGGFGPVEDPPAGRPVRLWLPLDATVEEVLPALAHLRLAGVTGFTFR
jgi:hypothetical protein